MPENTTTEIDQTHNAIKSLAHEALENPDRITLIRQNIARQQPIMKFVFDDVLQSTAAKKRAQQTGPWTIAVTVMPPTGKEQLPHYPKHISAPINPRLMSKCQNSLLCGLNYNTDWLETLNQRSQSADYIDTPSLRFGVFKIPKNTKDIAAWHQTITPLPGCYPWTPSLPISYDLLGRIEVDLMMKNKAGIATIDTNVANPHYAEIVTDREKMITTFWMHDKSGTPRGKAVFDGIKSHWYLSAVNDQIILSMIKNDQLTATSYQKSQRSLLMPAEWHALIQLISTDTFPTGDQLITAAMRLTANDRHKYANKIAKNPIPGFLALPEKERKMLVAALSTHNGAPRN